MNVSAISVIDLAEQLLKRQIISYADCMKISLELYRVLSDQHTDFVQLQKQHYPRSWLIALWQLAASRSADDLGITLGQQITPDRFGLLANRINAAKTLAEAFALFQNNSGWLNADERWCLSQEQQLATFQFEFATDDYPVIAIQRSMSALLAWTNYLLPEQMDPVLPQVCEFTFACPQSIQVFQQTFGMNCRFGCPENKISFKKELLSQRSRFANPLLEQVLKNEMARFTNSVSLLDVVEKLLRENLQYYAEQQHLLQALAISQSSLFRQLKQHGTSYQQLRDRARLDKYRQMHRKNMPAFSMYQELGFKSASALYKAKARWENKGSA